MLLKLEGSQYSTQLDLNMGYYHIRIRKNECNLCTIIIPWGKYCYKRLPMVIANPPDTFQQKMNNLSRGIGFICASTWNTIISDSVITQVTG